MAEAVEKRREAETLGPPVGRPRSAVYGGRFMLAYLLVVLVFGGVIALFAYLVSRSDSQPWSRFEPKGSGLTRATNIANYVAPRYRQGRGQLSVVEAQPPVIQNLLIDAVAIGRRPTRGLGGGYSSVLPAANTLLYVFCGRGQGCTLPGGPTVARGRLLRRQSLELALFTFKYMGDVDSVVTLLPPRKGVSPAVFLQRRALEKQLSKPLEETLPEAGPFTVDTIGEDEQSTVEALTAKRWYSSKFQQLPNGRALLVLTKAG